MIVLEGLSITFGEDLPLLRDVNLAVRRGETFVVVGPSGVGKSVLLKTIAGLITPTKGRVLIDGANLHQLKKSEQAAVMMKMGMLFQKNALFDSLTVSENLAFPLREATGLSENEIQEKIAVFLKHVGLSHAAELMPNEISGGMQKRLGVARALILNPQIILYDDPTAGLDPITSRMIIELITRLNKEFGTTVLAITNEMNRAYQMADRIGVILDGELLITGNVEETKKFPDPRVQDFILGRFKDEIVSFATGPEATWL